MPTLGYTTQGTGGTQTLENVIVGGLVTTPTTADVIQVQDIKAYLDTSATQFTTKCAIYTAAGSLVANSSTDVITGVSGAAWRTFTYSGTKPTLASNTQYVIVAWCQLRSGTNVISYNTGAPAGNAKLCNGQTYGTFPSTVTWSGEYTYYASIYLDYILVKQLQPPAGSLTLTGQSVSRQLSIFRAPGAGSLTLAGGATGLVKTLAVPAAGQTQTINAQVAHTDDDAWQAFSGDPPVVGNYGTKVWTTLGYPGSPILNFDGFAPAIAGFRYLGVSIPQGATITSAKIQLYLNTDAVNNGWNHAWVTIIGDKENNPVRFVEADPSGDQLDDRPRTTATVQWHADITNTVGFHDSPSLVSIIQEIVNQPGFAGQALTLYLFQDTAGGVTPLYVTQYEENAAWASKLDVEYGSAGLCLTGGTPSYTNEPAGGGGYAGRAARANQFLGGGNVY